MRSGTPGGHGLKAWVRTFNPEKLACVCARPAVDWAILTEWENRDNKATCVQCHTTGRRGTGYDRWRNVGEEGGAAVHSCNACYASRRRSTGGEASVASKTAGRQRSGGAPERQREATVRDELDGLLGRGEIVFGEDVVGRLAEERAKVNYTELKPDSARRVVRKMFGAVADAYPKKARVVVSGVGPAVEGDGHERPHFLVPSPLSDDVLVGYFLWARQSDQESAPHSTPFRRGRGLVRRVRWTVRSPPNASVWILSGKPVASFGLTWRNRDAYEMLLARVALISTGRS